MFKAGMACSTGVVEGRGILQETQKLFTSPIEEGAACDRIRLMSIASWMVIRTDTFGDCMVPRGRTVVRNSCCKYVQYWDIHIVGDWCFRQKGYEEVL